MKSRMSFAVFWLVRNSISFALSKRCVQRSALPHANNINFIVRESYTVYPRSTLAHRFGAHFILSLQSDELLLVALCISQCTVSFNIPLKTRLSYNLNFNGQLSFENL